MNPNYGKWSHDDFLPDHRATRYRQPDEWDAATATVMLPSMHWMKKARCRDLSGDWYFSSGDYSPHVKRLCARCPVNVDCLEWALTYEEQGHSAHGIFGGKTAQERHDLVVERQRRQIPRAPRYPDAWDLEDTDEQQGG